MNTVNIFKNDLAISFTKIKVYFIHFSYKLSQELKQNHTIGTYLVHKSI